jgi:hypothetical protein
MAISLGLISVMGYENLRRSVAFFTTDKTETGERL